MGMTPDEYLVSFVQGNYQDCVENPGCVRRAFNAAVSAAHLADTYHEYYQKNNASSVMTFDKLYELVNHVSASTKGYFKDIRSISNAYKHLYTWTDPVRAAYSSISSAGTIQSVDIEDEDGSIDHIQGDDTSRVMYTRKDGQVVEFLPALKEVVEYWEDTILEK